jgi:hypothetical protein
MGDRANVLVKHDAGDNGVWLYTHWYGSKLPEILQTALKRKQRWDDASYLARIIFSEMIKDDVDGETGYGISSELGDGGNHVLEVNVQEQTVSYESKTYSFTAFCRLELEGFWAKPPL